MISSPSVGLLLQSFFVDHLLRNKQASHQTVHAYRDTFRLLLEYMRDTVHIAPEDLRVSELSAECILSFLDHLEQKRGNCGRSRNARLAAIRSFFRFVALRQLDCIAMATQVLAIPIKRTDRRIVGYLTRTEMEAIIAAPPVSSWIGRRDHALILTLYNTGARVSEIAYVRRSQFQFGSSNYIQLKGKGRKERTVPLWSKTVRFLQSWFKEIQKSGGDLAFPNARGAALTRHGVTYILDQAFQKAARNCASLQSKSVSPHVIRHTTAMHLLQSGVDISVIALWLGHESTETTHIYVEADLATKERALEKLAPVASKLHRFCADDSLMSFLGSL